MVRLPSPVPNLPAPTLAPGSRTRKIRCDGARPKCQKCVRRSSECEYDAAPKRRGPDRKPGARQRTSRQAKEARAAASRRGEAQPLDQWAAGANDSDGDDDGAGGAGRKRRKGSHDMLSASLTWAADAEEAGSPRGSSATVSSGEGAAPLTPGDVQGTSAGGGATGERGKVGRPVFRGYGGPPSHSVCGFCAGGAGAGAERVC